MFLFSPVNTDDLFLLTDVFTHFHCVSSLILETESLVNLNSSLMSTVNGPYTLGNLH